MNKSVDQFRGEPPTAYGGRNMSSLDAQPLGNHGARYNPITNPIPNINQNPYIAKERIKVNQSAFLNVGNSILH